MHNGILGEVGVALGKYTTIYMYIGIEENLTKPPISRGKLLVRLHYREIDIFLNHGIRLDFRNGWCYSLIYIYF